MERIKTSKFPCLYPNTCIIGEKTPPFSSLEVFEEKQFEEGSVEEPSLFSPSLLEFFHILDIIDERGASSSIYLSPEIMERVLKDEKASTVLDFLFQRSFVMNLQIYIHVLNFKDLPGFIWTYCPRVFYQSYNPIDFVNITTKELIARLLHFFSYDKDWTPELSYRLSKAVTDALVRRDIQADEEYCQKQFLDDFFSFIPFDFLFEKEREVFFLKTFSCFIRTICLYTKEQKDFLLKRTSKRKTLKESFLENADGSFIEAIKAKCLIKKAFKKYEKEMDTITV